jgi:peptidoglycan/LPS O-acetylase OafA/YrhL
MRNIRSDNLDHLIPSRAPSLDREGNTIPFLDSLRFVAAIMVMLNHLRVNQFQPFGDVAAGSVIFKICFFGFTRLGLEAVVVFFVLSGFLVGGVSIERAIKGKLNLEKYFIDRLTRIYVPFLPAIFLDIAVCLVLGIAFSWEEASINIASLQGVLGEPFSGNTSLWSLSYEVWFYVLLGTILTMVDTKNKNIKIFTLFVLATSLFIFTRLNVVYLFSWIIGLVLYFLRPKPSTALSILSVALISAGVVLMQITSESRQLNLAPYGSIDRPFGILTLSMGLALLISMSSQLKIQSVVPYYVDRYGRAMAKFSYSLYLIHIPCIIIMSYTGFVVKQVRLDVGTLIVFLGNALIIIIVAFGFYWLFERQTAWIRRRLYSLRANSKSLAS